MVHIQYICSPNLKKEYKPKATAVVTLEASDAATDAINKPNYLKKYCFQRKWLTRHTWQHAAGPGCNCEGRTRCTSS